MKINQEQYEEMKSKLDELVRTLGEERLKEHIANLKADPKVNDLQMRFRWDLVWAAKIDVCAIYDVCGVDNSHIDTALKKYMKESGLNRLLGFE